MRVSDLEQTENLQIDALNAAKCDLVFSDHGVSGAKAERKGLSDLFAKLQTGDTLIVWKLDRLGRSTIHLLLMMDELRKKGVDFVAITQGIDTTTAIGRMLFGQLAVFAEFEREQIRERTKAGMAAAKARGKHVGRPRKLSVAQVRKAVRLIGEGRRSLVSVSREFEVSVVTLSRAMGRL